MATFFIEIFRLAGLELELADRLPTLQSNIRLPFTLNRIIFIVTHSHVDNINFILVGRFPSPSPIGGGAPPPARLRAIGGREARGGSCPSGQRPGAPAPGKDRMASPDQISSHTSTTPTNLPGTENATPRLDDAPHGAVPQLHWARAAIEVSLLG